MPDSGSFQATLAGGSPISFDNGSASINYNAGGSTYRGVGSSWFNAGNIAREDFLREQQALDNQLVRDKYFLGLQQAFNSSEAQKVRDFEERMSSTAYQRAVNDMKVAGLNPLLAYQQGGASTPSSPVASSSGGRSSSSGHTSYRIQDPLGSVLGSVIKVMAGALTHNTPLLLKGVMDTVVDYDKGKTYVRSRDFSYGKK